MQDQGRLRPGVALLWRSLTDVQVGTDPRWSVVLADLSPTASRALRRVAPGADVRALRAELARHDVDPAEADAVVDHLRAARLVVRAPARAGRHPDRTAWSLLDVAGDGDAVLAARARRRVRVQGLDRVGAQIAVALAAADVGTLEPADPAPVTTEDVGPAGVGLRDVGRPREAVVGEVLRRCADGVRVAAPRRGSPPDVVVLVEPGAADPERQRALMADDVPHLSVVVREASVLVGPFVVPGRTACLRCADLHRVGHDPRWPALVAQLVDRPVTAETTLAVAAAGIAAAQVTAYLDGRPVAVAEASLELRLPDLMPRRTTWPPHPRCGCGGLDAT